MKERIIQAFERFTISFTMLVIFYLLFLNLGFEELDSVMVKRLLYICAAVAVAQLITNYLLRRSLYLQMVVAFVDMVVVVFFMGIVVFHIFEISLSLILIILGLLILIFFFTSVFSYLIDYKKIMEINQIIKRNDETTK